MTPSPTPLTILIYVPVPSIFDISVLSAKTIVEASASGASGED